MSIHEQCVCHTGVYEDILLKVESGYRMPNPASNRVICPAPVYDTMLRCWKRNPEDRPTFEYLKIFFDDYEVCSEEHYAV